MLQCYAVILGADARLQAPLAVPRVIRRVAVDAQPVDPVVRMPVRHLDRPVFSIEMVDTVVDAGERSGGSSSASGKPARRVLLQIEQRHPSVQRTTTRGRRLPRRRATLHLTLPADPQILLQRLDAVHGQAGRSSRVAKTTAAIAAVRRVRQIYLEYLARITVNDWGSNVRSKLLDEAVSDFSTGASRVGWSRLFSAFRSALASTMSRAFP